MTETPKALSGGFPARNETDWRALAEKALRGADFDATLGRETADRLMRGPAFFTRPDGAHAVDTRPKDEYLPWGMRQAIVEPDPQSANEAALADLMGGVSELQLNLDPEGRHGLKANEIDTLDAALKGIDLSLAPIHLETLRGQGHHADLLLTLFARRRLDGEGLRGGLGINPIGRSARQGVALSPDCFDKAKALLELSQAAFPQLTIFRADGALAFEAGATEAQELAVMAGSVAAYMRLMGDAGLDANTAAPLIELRLAADTDIHVSIAKLRAARQVFARIVSSFGADGPALRANIQAVTAARMLSAKDPWTNLIRNACAGFAAASGGADAITIRPLTDALGRPSGFARRVARNLHTLLAEESHIGKVTDPAAGSYLHETLARNLAEKAWEIFQEIEARGGLAAAFADGSLQTAIAASRSAAMTRIAEGEAIILGVTKYPDPDPRAVQTRGSWGEEDWPERR